MKEEKCYIVTCDCSCKAELTIYANSKEEAIKLAQNQEYNDKEIKTFKVEDVMNVEVN